MMLWRYLRILGNYPLSEICRYLAGKLQRKLATSLCRYVDKRRATYTVEARPEKLLAHFPPASPDLVASLEDQREIIIGLASEYMSHRFDLLGSGWNRVYHGMECRGLHDYRYQSQSGSAASRLRFANWHNCREAEKIAALIDACYTPIDWHLDFKSGYRWQPDCWYRDVTFGKLPGVDIKVPWELARMQHLPMLAWAFGLTVGSDITAANGYRREFRNQILDFLSANPPRYGVNWYSTMDVAIRLVNWLVAFDLFRAFGAVFDDEFEKGFVRAVYEHTRHCVRNLEFSLSGRNNHYLADIAGIFIAAAYLPADKESGRWLSFAGKELVREMDYQFTAEGTSGESSTMYHCLATEMMLWCGLFSRALQEEKRSVFPQTFWERLERALEFIQDSMKPNKEVPQIGDCDSGRFLKLWPLYDRRTVGEAAARYENLAGYPESDKQQIYWDENGLVQSHLSAIGALLFAGSRLTGESRTPEAKLVKLMIGDKCVASYHARTADRQNSGQASPRCACKVLPDEYHRGNPSVAYRIKLPAEGLRELRCFAYPAFGLYIYKTPRVYLAVRCGRIGRCGRGGHAHNDQLAVELSVDGVDIIRDPGTYLYTALPEMRNRFRSTKAHFTPQLGRLEQNGWTDGPDSLFVVSDNCKAQCLAFGHDGFIGVHHGFGGPVYRTIRFSGDALIITDFGGGQPQAIPHGCCHSPGYGRLIEE